MMLRAVFYARFHPDRGPSIIHQYPPAGSVVSAWDAADRSELFNVQDIVNYIIPTYELCERPLSVAVPAISTASTADATIAGTPLSPLNSGWEATHQFTKASTYRILGFPISIEDVKYDRNRFTFNVCYVLEDGQDVKTWNQLVKKTACFFRALEVEDGLLSSEEDLPGLKWAGEDNYPAEDVGIVYSVLQAIFEDLNAHDEACVQIDDLHVLNLQLVKNDDRPLPPRVHSYQVPLLVKHLPKKADWTYDLTLDKIVQHIDGVKHVMKIAEEADVELKLVQKTVRELLRIGAVMLLDLFHFQACYTTTTDFAWFVNDKSMVDECARYIADGIGYAFFDDTSTRRDSLSSTREQTLLSHAAILEMYADLRPGLTLAEFCLKHIDRLATVDIRRFITFGVIKGFIRRLHRYALLYGSQTRVSTSTTAKAEMMSRSFPKSSEEAAIELDKAWKKAALSSGWATPPSSLPENSPLSKRTSGGLSRSTVSNEEAKKARDAKLKIYLDGRHCLDQACVELRMTEKQVADRLRSGAFGEVMLFWR